MLTVTFQIFPRSTERLTFLVVVNLFYITGLFIHLLKTSENLWLFDVFRWYRKRPVARNWLKINLNKVQVRITDKDTLSGAPKILTTDDRQVLPSLVRS